MFVILKRFLQFVPVMPVNTTSEDIKPHKKKALGVRYFEEILTVCPCYVSVTPVDIKPHK